MVELGAFFLLRRGRHTSVFGSAISAGIGRIYSSDIGASLRRRHRHWFEFIVAMAAPLGSFAVLAGSSTDGVARWFMICFAIYADFLIALLWFTEEDDVPNEPTQRPKRRH
jgi:hypothetical protein